MTDDSHAADLERELQRLRALVDGLETANADLERRGAEHTMQLELAHQELDSLSYAVSHDLRAPLRAIQGFSQALLEDYDEQLGDQGRHFLDRVRVNTQRLEHLIDDLLALSRLGRVEMYRAPVDLSALARAAAAELQKVHSERRVTCTIRDGLGDEADERLLRIVLENLLGNAWKFTSKCPEARVEFDAIDHIGQPAYFVRDNGVGFDMSQVDRLFGAFQRLHAATDFAGQGMGLATVRRIIHRHGGRTWAEGSIGVGATFYFTLGGGAS